MYNLYDRVISRPDFFRQLSCRDLLFTVFSCPLDHQYQDLWSHYNYVVYVTEGRKVWHTSHGSYDLHEGTCVFVRKGACIVEQYFDSRVCFVIFFMPDEFICETLKSRTNPIRSTETKHDSVISIENCANIETFFHGMKNYFDSIREPDPALLELKFRELILTIAGNDNNTSLISYFGALMNEPQNVSLHRVMEDNFMYNLKLEEYARLSSRSLSAFKRDFLKVFNTTPGKWLMEKRLNHALHLLTNLSKPVNEAAFESGFESASHFSRAFRQRYGLSPAAFRQKELVS